MGEMTTEQIIQDLKNCKTFYDFLEYVRDTEGLRLQTDNNWSWVEYNGEEIEWTAQERFVEQSEIDALLKLAGLK